MNAYYSMTSGLQERGTKLDATSLKEAMAEASNRIGNSPRIGNLTIYFCNEAGTECAVAQRHDYIEPVGATDENGNIEVRAHFGAWKTF